MYFDSFSEFLAMGGHGKYVWIAYGLGAVIFALNLVAPMLKRKRLVVEQTRQLRREELHASDS